MGIFFPEPSIDIGKVGFQGNCDLGRSRSGEKLSELVEKISEPVVIAADGPWGSGKSHFLKLWTGAHQLENEGSAKVIYFDAFQHDYFDDPLVALVGQIFEDFSEENALDGKMKTFLKYAGRLIKPVTRIALAAGTGLASEALGKVAADATNALGKEAEKALDPVWENESNRRDAMEGFKKALKDLTIASSPEEEPKKIVVIIDELDRCRPDFALNMLETIKHFFAVENVIFVLGVNLVELENSVKARYGAGINAGKYLQKFIHIRFVIEERETYSGKEDIALKYFNHIATPDVLTSASYREYLHLYLRNLDPNVQPNLREVQRLITSAVIAPNNYKLDPDIYLIAGLLIMSVTAPETISEAKAGILSFEKVERLLSLQSGKPKDDPQFFSGARDVWRLCLDPSFVCNMERLRQIGYPQGRTDRPNEMVPRVANFLFGAIDVTRLE